MREIFLVHDELESHWVRQHFLESSGYKVTPFESGEECISALVTRKPDLILMDVLIQGRNGFETCKQIRRETAAAELPIVLCSEVYRSRLFQDEAVNVGAQGYVLKPCRLDDLVQIVNATLAGQKAEPDVAA